MFANAYAFNVKRLSLMSTPNFIQPGTATGVGAGLGAYEGDQVYVLASTLPNAMAVLQAQYGADLGPVSGGAALVTGALTTATI